MTWIRALLCVFGTSTGGCDLVGADLEKTVYGLIGGSFDEVLVECCGTGEKARRWFELSRKCCLGGERSSGACLTRGTLRYKGDLERSRKVASVLEDAGIRRGRGDLRLNLKPVGAVGGALDVHV